MIYDPLLFNIKEAEIQIKCSGDGDQKDIVRVSTLQHACTTKPYN